MTRLWIGCTADESRDELERALMQACPHAHLVFAKDAADIRCRLRDEEPKTVGAIVGLSAHGVSDVNLAAALASDGRASEVILVARFVTGSLRSRAVQAGISQVIDIDDIIFDELASGVADVSDTGTLGTPVDESPVTKDLAPIIVLASGRGGVGKTSIAALGASTMAHWGLDVALCDLDLANGNLPSCFGVGTWTDPSSYVLGGVLDVAQARGACVKAADGVSLWGPCVRPEMAEQAMPAVRSLLSELSCNHDVVVVDTSSTCTDGVAQAMQAADRLILLHDAGPGSIAPLARVSALAVRLGVARARIVRVENGCLPRMVASPFTPLAEVGLETAKAMRVPEGGDEIRELLSGGRVDELRELGGGFARGVATVFATVLEELGMLPDNEAARRAARKPRQHRGLSLFSRRGEVA